MDVCLTSSVSLKTVLCLWPHLINVHHHRLSAAIQLPGLPYSYSFSDKSEYVNPMESHTLRNDPWHFLSITGRVIQFSLSLLVISLNGVRVYLPDNCSLNCSTIVFNNVTIDGLIQPLGMTSLNDSPNTLVFILSALTKYLPIHLNHQLPQQFILKIATTVSLSPLRTER